MSKVSIIVTAYNVEKYIHKCVESLTAQTYPDIEVIVIDDGSKDKTGVILDRAFSQNPKVTLVHTANCGVASARNTGISLCTGEYIMFIDGDDWIDPDTCEKVVLEAQKTDADLVMWSYVREYDSGSFPRTIMERDCSFTSPSEIRNLFRRIIGLTGQELGNPENSDSLSTVCCKLYRRDLIVDNDIKFVSIDEIGPTEDLLFNISLMNYVKRACFINKCFYHYRRTNSSSITTRYKGRLYEQMQNAFTQIRKCLKTKSEDKEFEDALNNRICLSIIGIGLNEIRKSNPKPVLDRLRYLRRVLTADDYKKAYKSFSLEYLPLKWKIFFFCAKYRVTPFLYFLLILIDFLRKQSS